MRGLAEGKRTTDDGRRWFAHSVVVLATAKPNTLEPLDPASARKRQAPDEFRSPRPKRLTDTNRKDIVERYQAGETAAAIATSLGFSKTTILDALKQAGVAMRPRGPEPRQT